MKHLNRDGVATSKILAQKIVSSKKGNNTQNDLTMTLTLRGSTLPNQPNKA